MESGSYEIPAQNTPRKITVVKLSVQSSVKLYWPTVSTEIKSHSRHMSQSVSTSTSRWSIEAKIIIKPDTTSAVIVQMIHSDRKCTMLHSL